MDPLEPHRRFDCTPRGKIKAVALEARIRPSDEDPAGALVLFHGRGADEYDLFPLLDLLDPGRHLVGATPRGPLTLPPGGRHWYALGGIPTPDAATFHASYAAAEEWLDGFLEEHGLGHERLVVGGFSQGAVMSYALGLGQRRPRPAAITAFSGFIPRVDGFELDLSPPLPPVAIGHGTHDPVIEVRWGRDARDLLAGAGAEVLYRESPMAHQVDPGFLHEVAMWLDGVLAEAAER
jgi:phospholipase/carboxylesterase